MNLVFLACGAYLALVAQGASGLYRAPDWGILWAVFLGCYLPPRTALIGAWASGLARDLASACPPGTHALCALATAWAASSLRTRVERNHPLAQAGLALMIGTPAIGMTGVGARLAGGGWGSGADALRETVWMGLWTAWAAPIAFLALRPLRRAFGIVDRPDLSR